MRSVAARRIVWFLAIVIGFVGLVVSFYLVGEHFKFPTAEAAEDTGLLDQACTAFATSNCGKVIKQSRWGVFPPRELDENGKIKRRDPDEPDYSIPTAELGMYFWTSVLIWLFVIGIPSSDRAWVHAIFFLVTFLGLGISAFLAYVMFFGGDMEAWCPLCTVTHVCALVLVILAALMWPRSAPVAAATVTGRGNPSAESSNSDESGSLFGSSPKKGHSPTAPRRATTSGATGGASGSWPPTYLLGMVAFIIVIALFGERAYAMALKMDYKLKVARLQRERLQPYQNEYFRNFNHGYIAWATFPEMKIDLEGVPMRGEEAAPYEVVIFSDFECPACANFEQVYEKQIRPVFAQLGGVKTYFKHWPICTECNPQAMSDLHPMACVAARAAEGALIVGGEEAFWKMHDILFGRQGEWKKAKKPEDFLPYARKYAEELGLNVDAFVEAMNSEAALERIQDDVADSLKIPQQMDEKTREKFGDWVKVNSTPTVFLNGRQVHPSRLDKLWVRILQGEAQRRAAQRNRQDARPNASGQQPSEDQGNVEADAADQDSAGPGATE